MKKKTLHITDTKLFQFTQPEFDLGQKVESQDGLTGYVVGVDFYPETQTWSYGIYVLNRRNEAIEEIWYEAEQLTAAVWEFRVLKGRRKYPVQGVVKRVITNPSSAPSSLQFWAALREYLERQNYPSESHFS